MIPTQRPALPQNQALKVFLAVVGMACLIAFGAWLYGVITEPREPEVTELYQNTQLELVDWHISGLWVINSPVAWVKVTNNNTVPVHVCFEYKTYNHEGKQLDRGTFNIEEPVQPGTTKGFIELYLGLVDLYTERLSVKLMRVRPAH